MPLFVKLKSGSCARRGHRATRSAPRCAGSIRRATCPTRSTRSTAIPFTLTGKKMEVPVRRILMGVAPEKAANRDAVANPQALDYFIDYAKNQTDYSLTA